MSDLITMDYLSASLVGYNATDTISISSSAGVSVSNMPFMAVAVQTGFAKEFDGILGLSRQYVDETDGSFKHQPLFLEQAQLASVITAEIIAFSMSKTSTQSFADVGAINLAGVKDGDASNIVYLPVPDLPYFWYSAQV